MRTRRLSGIVAWLVILIVYAFISSSLWIFHGPFSGLREYVIDSLATTRHAYLLRPLSLFTLSEKEIAAHTADLQGGNAGTTALAQAERDYRSMSGNVRIDIANYQGRTFSAKIMSVYNPLRVKVVATQHLGDVGETVSEMVARENAVAGVNGGAFRDVAYRGTGGVPLGITISDGKVISAQHVNNPVIAITRNGALIAGSYSLAQLRQLGVQQALSFGPILIQNGKNVVQGSGGWGYAPRTAIGQRADGTILFVVTDGRFVHGPSNVGASLADVAAIMAQHGAVVAANLDGGSSTTMVYQGKLVNNPTDILGERKVATAWIVK